MPNLKITEFPLATEVTANDIIPFVDIDGTPTTKKITIENLFKILGELGTDGEGNYIPYGHALDGIRNITYPLNRPITKKLTDTNPNLTGFAGGFQNGQYVYLVPNISTYVTKINDTDFTDITFLNLGIGNDGFVGGFTDGIYAYFVPNNNGIIVRLDLRDFATITTLDLTTTHINLKEFAGGFFHNNFGYFIPNKHGIIAKVDLSDFTTVTTLDLPTTQADTDLMSFYGGFVDTGFAYLIPNNDGTSPMGKMVKVDLSDFLTVVVTDLSLTNSNIVGLKGGFSDGRYGYGVPNEQGYLVRWDILVNGRVSYKNLIPIDAQLTKFVGGMTDGRYAYLIPNGEGSSYSKLVRFDLTDIQNDSSFEVIDLALEDANFKGFKGGIVTRNNIYLIPNENEYLARISTSHAY